MKNFIDPELDRLAKEFDATMKDALAQLKALKLPNAEELLKIPQVNLEATIKGAAKHAQDAIEQVSAMELKFEQPLAKAMTPALDKDLKSLFNLEATIKGVVKRAQDVLDQISAMELKFEQPLAKAMTPPPDKDLKSLFDLEPLTEAMKKLQESAARVPAELKALRAVEVEIPKAESLRLPIAEEIRIPKAESLRLPIAEEIRIPPVSVTALDSVQESIRRLEDSIDLATKNLRLHFERLERLQNNLPTRPTFLEDLDA